MHDCDTRLREVAKSWSQETADLVSPCDMCVDRKCSFGFMLRSETQPEPDNPFLLKMAQDRGLTNLRLVVEFVDMVGNRRFIYAGDR